MLNFQLVIKLAARLKTIVFDSSENQQNMYLFLEGNKSGKKSGNVPHVLLHNSTSRNTH